MAAINDTINDNSKPKVFLVKTGVGMGTLRNTVSGHAVPLRSVHVFGSHSNANTVLHYPQASVLHASIRWVGVGWEIHDLSNEGIVLDNRPLARQSRTMLRQGATIKFGAAAPCEWLVVDVAGPYHSLWPLDDQSPVIDLTSVSLPASLGMDSLPISRDSAGRWVYEREHKSRAIHSGDEVRIGGSRWCFLSSDPGPRHEGGASLGEDIVVLPARPAQKAERLLLIQVSLDEEHTTLSVTEGDATIDLGERAHHYCILALARCRIADAKRGFDRSSQGWTDLSVLSNMLGVDESHINIQIFRARKQIERSFPEGADMPELIERRRGQVRFGDWTTRIERGAALESLFVPPPVG